jgi:hypothetical protein
MNWILYVLVAVFIIGVIVKLFDLSPVHLALRAGKEIIEVITNKNITRTSIDGALTIMLAVFTAACVFFLLIERLSDFVMLLAYGIDKEHQPLLFIVFLMFFDAIVVIISILVTRDRDQA